MKVNNPNYLNGLGSSASEIDGLSNIHRNTIVLDGDSFAAGNTYGYVEQYTHQYNAQGSFQWANYYMLGKLRIIKNNGVGGETTSQLLARLQSSIDLNPRFISINIGTNDLAQSVALETIIQNIQTIFDRISKAGIITILHNITPKDVADVTIMSKTNLINQYIREMQFKYNNLIVVDAFSQIVNPATELAFTGLLKDGLHPSIKGCELIGAEIARCLDKYIPSVSVFRGCNSVANNILPNGYMLGGTDTATSWSCTINSGTAIKSKIARDNGLEWQQLEFTTLGDFTLYTNPNPKTNFAVGDKLQLFCEIEVDEDINTLSKFSISLDCRTSVGGALSAVSGFYNDGGVTSIFPNKGMYGILQCAPTIVPSNTGFIRVAITGKLLGKIRIGRCYIAKID